MHHPTIPFLLHIVCIYCIAAILFQHCNCSTSSPTTHNLLSQFTGNSPNPSVAAEMSTSEAGSATVIHIDDSNTAGKAPVTAVPPPPSAPPAPMAANIGNGTSAAAPVQQRKARGVPFILRSGADGFRRCMALIDLLFRVLAFGPTLAAAISTGTSNETLSVFTEFFQFHARFDDFPAFTFFMVANAIAAGYLVLSFPFSAVGIIRPKATGVRLLLLICDTVIMALLTAAAAAAAAIVYVAHEGNHRANWVPICLQFHGFCERTSGAVVASFRLHGPRRHGRLRHPQMLELSRLLPASIKLSRSFGLL